MPFGDVVVRAPKGPVRLHYIDASPTGNVAAPAQVVVLSHGLLLPATKLYPASGIADADCLAFFWRDQIPELCRAGFRCIAYDHRGQGTSERSEDCDLDILADDAIGLIQQLCPGTRVHFVGHSMGGFVGLRVAVKRPDLVQSLALINSSASEDPNRHFYAVLGRLSTWYWPFPGLVASYTVRRILGTSSRADTRQAELVRELVDHIGQVQRYSGVMSITPAAQAVFFRKAVPPTDLARIACPTLILVRTTATV
ncbi:unnamed protein product [Pedinophyceae sp. YPF-701]|nr:unnamed protein product [Pedinophyceae sp. YPF-701]